ncbi:MAG: chorismate-binding protein [Flavobacteriales bacterium]|nr:chorismate-binding protein [Flavobacteriales bacterium]MCB9194355.1 chorismate-binding protein [Flavobacteriales bacterium]
MSQDIRDAIGHCLRQSLTFAAFRAPGQPATIWAQRDPDLDHVDPGLLWELNDAFVMAPFEQQGERLPIIRADVELTFGDLPVFQDHLHACSGRPANSPPPAQPTERAVYEQLVSEALASIGRGELEKVVLSRIAIHQLDRTDLTDLFVQALDEMPNALVALMHTPDHGTWLGASPERLVLAEEDLVQLDALAGTRPVEEAPGTPEEWGAKERHEQMLVTRSVVEGLLELGLKDIHISGPEVVHAGPVAHLRTRIEADMTGHSLDEVVFAVHPTPAVCGTPRNKARAFIKDHEPHDRGLYSGFWGPWRADGRTELFVNIRCLQALSDHAVFHLGAGITAGSEPAKEWDETSRKAEFWMKALEASRSASPPA